MNCPKCNKEYVKRGWFFKHLAHKHPDAAAAELALLTDNLAIIQKEICFFKELVFTPSVIK